MGQCGALWCSVLQCVDLCDSLPSEISEMLAYVQVQFVAVCCSVLKCVAVCCSVLQCVAVWCSVSQCGAACCNVLICAIVFHLRFLRCSPMCQCSVFQCGAVCGGVLQYVLV